MKAITIITVCYNEERNIARTIESVLMQTSDNFEYIICDGKSKDNTVQIAKRYQPDFENKGVSFKIYSEADKGIYDAMNKGINRASGRYIWFVNSGDWLVCADAVERFAECVENNSIPAVYFADFFFVENHMRRQCVCNIENIKRYMSLGHPSLISRTDLMRERRFDLGYRIAADYYFVLGLFMDKFEFQKIDFAATYFMTDGVSSTSKVATEEEVKRIHDFYGLPHESQETEELSSIGRIRRFLSEVAPKWLWKFWCVKVRNRYWVDY